MRASSECPSRHRRVGNVYSSSFLHASPPPGQHARPTRKQGALEPQKALVVMKGISLGEENTMIRSAHVSDYLRVERRSRLSRPRSAPQHGQDPPAPAGDCRPHRSNRDGPTIQSAGARGTRSITRAAPATVAGSPSPRLPAARGPCRTLGETPRSPPWRRASAR